MIHTQMRVYQTKFSVHPRLSIHHEKINLHSKDCIDISVCMLARVSINLAIQEEQPIDCDHTNLSIRISKDITR